MAGSTSTQREPWEAAGCLPEPGDDGASGFHGESFLALVPDPGALTLGVGLGDGGLARALTGLGHRVLALEPVPVRSRRAADADGGLLGVLRGDAGALPVADAAADLVVAFMSRQDMNDVQRAVREFARVLRPTGRLCLAVEHPIGSAGEFSGSVRDAEFVIADSYFQARPLEDYCAALASAGFLIEDLREPRPGNGGPWDRVPLFLDLRAVRT